VPHKSRYISDPLSRLFGEGFNLPLLLYVLRKSLVWMALFLLMAVAAVWIYLRYTAPAYEATARVMYKPPEATQALSLDVTDIHRYDAFSDVQVIRSPLILKRALKKVPLAVSYFTKGKFMNTELYTNTPFVVDARVNDSSAFNQPFHVQFHKDNTYSIHYANGTKLLPGPCYPDSLYHTALFDFRLSLSRPGLPASSLAKREMFFVLNQSAALISRLQQEVHVSVASSRSQILSITVRDHVPAKARDLANAIAQVFIQYDRERQMQSANNVLDFINRQLDTLTADLIAGENALKDFKQAERLISPETEQGFLQTQLNTLDEKILELENKKRSIQWFEDYIASGKSLTALSANVLGNYTDFSVPVQNLVDLEQEKRELLVGLTENHIRIQFLNKQIEAARQDLLSAIANARQTTENELQRLNQRYRDLEKEYYNLPEKEAELLRLSRITDLKQKYYLQFKEKQLEYEVIKAGIVSNFTLLEPASVGLLVAPRRRVIQLSGILLGLLLGIALVALRYMLQNKILSLSDLESLTDIPVLGIVPRYRQKMENPTLLVFSHPKSIMAESFRSIRANLEFLHSGSGKQSIAVTSTTSGEGKTFIALNLAGVLNIAGKKVILLDLDMRRPRIHLAMETENKTGMSTLLIGKHGLEDCVRHSPHEGLNYITAGPIPPNPAELLLSRSFQELLETLKEQYDYIVMDTPPVALVTDALQLMRLIDYPIYVLRSEYSNRDFLNLPNKWYDEKRIPNLSLVLNDVKLSRTRYGHYGYGGGYGYGYGYGYYADDHKARKKGWRRKKPASHG